MSARNSATYIANPEATKARSRAKVLSNPAAKKAADAAHYRANREARIVQQNAYVEANRDKYNAYRRELQKAKCATNSQYHLIRNLRKRTWDALRGFSKSAPTLALLGCTGEALRTHLEAQFKPGMTWENYGQWHVDHIKPCASFDLINPEQQRACFHWSNLQPMWGIENMSWGARAKPVILPQAIP